MGADQVHHRKPLLRRNRGRSYDKESAMPWHGMAGCLFTASPAEYCLGLF